MDYLIYFIHIILIKYTTAQVIALGGGRYLNNQNFANLPTKYANNAVLSNIGQQGYELGNIVVTPSNTQQQQQDYLLNNANYGNIGNNANIGGNNIGFANIGASNIGAYNVGSANIGASNIGASNVGLANIGASNIGASNFGASNVGLANIGASNVGLSNIGVSNVGLNNIGESAVVYKSVPMYANVVQPPREYGIEFSSGALQVGGNVEVNGRMPFNGNVEINGAVPTEGQGTVNYACDKANNEES